VQTVLESDLVGVQPVRFLPLNRGIGLPHLTVPVRFKEGARTVVHVQATPSGPTRVPSKVAPFNVPSKTRSFLLPSSSFGETNFRCELANSTEGRGRALPQRPTITAFN